MRKWKDLAKKVGVEIVEDEVLVEERKQRALVDVMSELGLAPPSKDDDADDD